MKKKYKLITLLTLVVVFVSCADISQKENNLSTLDKKSSREVALKSSIVGDSIYHITTQKIWANGQLIVEKTDTIKTIKEVKDWNDATPTSLVKAPIYVTVE